jgi:GNAT superfamily N-acetyltransferase
MLIAYREATTVDAPAMTRARADDAAAGPADPRVAAYLDGRHHPQQALAPRVAYVALDDTGVAGYIAGHLTTRFGCEGELQYLYVARHLRRRGVAGELLRRLAQWFRAHDARRVCVNVDVDSPAATPFYESQGATPLDRFWFAWDDIGAVLENPPTTGH